MWLLNGFKPLQRCQLAYSNPKLKYAVVVVVVSLLSFNKRAYTTYNSPFTCSSNWLIRLVHFSICRNIIQALTNFCYLNLSLFYKDIDKSLVKHIIRKWPLNGSKPWQWCWLASKKPVWKCIVVVVAVNARAYWWTIQATSYSLSVRFFRRNPCMLP